MSGIAALFSHRSVKEKEIKTMLSAIRHRGPNDEGVELFLGSVDSLWFAGLGYAHLAVDKASTQTTQAMHYRERYWISCDGCIYNNEELRQKLRARGHYLHTQSDSELILAAYAEWDVACVQYFNGMFAFIIIDNIKQQVFIARDRFAMKPLYIYQDDQSVAFASEVKALLAHPKIRQRVEPNKEECLRFLQEGMAEWHEHTLFTHIRRFPFSHYLKVSINQLLAEDWLVEPYWRFSSQCENCVFSTSMAALHIAEYKTLLHSSVQMHKPSDIPIGTALGGGLGSASLVALMHNELAQTESTKHKRMLTFSAVSTQNKNYQYEKNLEENDYIRLIEKYLESEAIHIQLDWKDMAKELERFIWALDSPPELSRLSSWYTFRAVAENNVKVVLNGLGADELLAGGLQYREDYSDVLLASTFHSIREVLLHVFKRETVERIMGLVGESVDSKQSLSEQLRYRFTHDLVNDLHYLDRASMAWSVETRMPFLDVRLVDYLFKLADGYKVRDDWDKWLARKAMENDLPEAVVWRKDHKTWPLPEKKWLSGALKYWLIDKIQASEFLKELGCGENVAARISSGELSMSLMRELNLALWHKLFFEEKGQQGRELGREVIKERLSFNPNEDMYARQRRQRERTQLVV